MSYREVCEPYPAAIAVLLHFKSFRGEANSRVTDAKPLSAT